MPENIKIILYNNPLNINDIQQITKFLKPITIDDIKCLPPKPYVENKKDLRCIINKYSQPREKHKIDS
jgi:hypothetical protein